MLKLSWIISMSAVAVLAGCATQKTELEPISLAPEWSQDTQENYDYIQKAEYLSGWWKKLKDQQLNSLVDVALASSPDRNIAAARIAEARGLRRSSQSYLLPSFGAFANANRGVSTATLNEVTVGQAGFDVSYEVDLWGKNSSELESADYVLQATQANYHAVALGLVAEISRAYTEYREYELQAAIAKKNVQIQHKTLELVKQRFEVGESPQLDVDRAENLVNTTLASIPEYERIKVNKKLELSILTGAMPQAINKIIKEGGPLPEFAVRPVLMAPATVIINRPDVQAASMMLASRTKLSESVTASLFPTLNLSGLYGVMDTTLISPTTIWNIAAGAAVRLLDFGRIAGQIDAANAQEQIAFEEYRKTVLQAVIDVESALNDYANINQKKIALYHAYNSAHNAHDISQTLYKEGENSFLDLLDSQRVLNAAESAYITANAEHTKAVIRLYKALGVY